MGEQILFVPLSDVERLMILKAVLEKAWATGKRFSISIICGATGTVTSFPMEGTMLVSCDRAEGMGIATKKAVVVHLTGASSSREIGEEWLSKPIKPGEEGTFIPVHRELAYLGDPAKITGYEGCYSRNYGRPVLIQDTTGQVTVEAIARWTVRISCSGDSGEIDAEYAEAGFAGFEKAWQQELNSVTFSKPK